MSLEQSAAVDAYIVDRLLTADPQLDDAVRASDTAGLPAIAVSPPQGKLLHLLARLRGARRILEVGTLGGYSTLWLAKALPVGGSLVSLELDPRHADVARASLAAAGFAEVVDVRIGAALDTLAAMAAADQEPYDLVFIDADKEHNADYVTASLALTAPGSVIIVDNVVRGGAVLDAASTDVAVLGVRRLYDLLAGEPRLDATAIQTVGAKGYDGFVVALVVGQ